MATLKIRLIIMIFYDRRKKCIFIIEQEWFDIIKKGKRMQVEMLKIQINEHSRY